MASICKKKPNYDKKFKHPLKQITFVCRKLSLNSAVNGRVYWYFTVNISEHFVTCKNDLRYSEFFTV